MIQYVTVCNVRNTRPMCSMKQPFNETNNHIDHFKKVNELSKSKKGMQLKLDKKLNMAMTYCSEDKHTPICKILWEEVHDCLVDIDTVNHEIKYHKWYIFIEE